MYEWTAHAEQRRIERGISVAEVAAALATPPHTGQQCLYYRCKSSNVTVVVRSGRCATVYRIKSKQVKKKLSK